jgi:predicted nucleic acid-binding protein
MLTYLDTGVLLSAWKGEDDISRRAFQILEDTSREFLASDFVRLELLPKAIYHKQQQELEFYQGYFDGTVDLVEADKGVFNTALQMASDYGLGAVDALHCAAAYHAKAAEFITAEKDTKPFFRVPGMIFRSIHKG